MLNSGSTALPYGESVGDRTGNLFDAEIVQGSFNSSTGAIRDATNRIRSNESDFIYLTTGTYTINADGVDDVVRYAYSSEDTSTFLYYRSMTSWQSLPHTFTVQAPCYFLFGFRFSDDSDIIPSDISNIMLNSGSTALTYEPYGYRVPIKVEGKNLLNINNFIGSVTHGSGIIKDNTLYLTATESDVHINSVAAADSVYDIINGLKIPCKAGKSYTLTVDPIFNECYITFYNNNNISLGYYFCQNAAITAPLNAVYMTLRLGVSNSESGETYSTKIMLAESISPIPYESYRTPITTNIYLLEQIKMVGDEAEYIDYAAQKMHRIGADDIDVTLPALPTLTGTNVLSVDTSVKPSLITVSSNELVSVGDKVTSGEHTGEYKVPVTVEGKNLAKNNYTTSSPSLSDLIVEKIGEFIHVSATNNTANAVPYVISKNNSFHAGTYDIVNNSDTMIAYDYKDENNNLIYNAVESNTVKSFIFPESAQRGLNIYKAISSGVHIDNYFQVMIVKHGDDTDTYEPYHTPVTTPIYLDAPLAKSGNNADYIDYAEQKRHNSDGTESSVTLPALPTVTGTNVLSVGTEVQPSEVYIKGKIKEIN